MPSAGPHPSRQEDVHACVCALNAASSCLPRLTSSPSAGGRAGHSHIPFAAEQKALHLARTSSPLAHQCFFRERLAASPLLPVPFCARAGQSRPGALGGAGAARPELPRARSATRRVRPVGSGTPRGPNRPTGAGPDGNSRRAPWLSRAVPAGAAGRSGAGRPCQHRTRPGTAVSLKLRVFYSKSQPVLPSLGRSALLSPRGHAATLLRTVGLFFAEQVVQNLFLRGGELLHAFMGK